MEAYKIKYVKYIDFSNFYSHPYASPPKPSILVAFQFIFPNHKDHILSVCICILVYQDVRDEMV